MAMSDVDHLEQAKRDIAAGDASSQRATDFYQRAADHIASALSGSTTKPKPQPRSASRSRGSAGL
jgi:hypothetical protein